MKKISAILHTLTTKITEFSQRIKKKASVLSGTAAEYFNRLPIRKLSRNTLLDAGSFLLILLAITAVCYFIVFPSKGHYNADCYDTLLWANASYESGRVFSENFHYSALLPFGAQLWMTPFIAMFGVTMKTQIAGMVVFMLLFSVSIIFLCISLGWNNQWTSATFFSVMLLLSAGDKLREIMWCHVIYYSLALLILFVLIALAVKLCGYSTEKIKQEPIRFAALCGAFFVLCACAATDGVQIIALTIVPAAGAAAAIVFVERRKLLSSANIGAGTVLALAGTGSIVGLIVLGWLKGDITAGYANAFSTFSDISVWNENAGRFTEQYFTLINSGVYDGKPIAELSSFVTLIRIAVGVIVLVIPAFGLLSFGKNGDLITRFITSVHIIVSAVIMFGFICGELSSASWRLIPMLGTGILTSIAVLRWISLNYKTFGRRAAAMVLVLILICSLFSAADMLAMDMNFGEDNAYYVLADELEKRGLTNGYASYWSASCITMAADNDVQVRNLKIENEMLLPYEYQSMDYWFETQEGQTVFFVALTQDEYNQIVSTEYWDQLLAQKYLYYFDCAGYIVTVFSSNIF